MNAYKHTVEVVRRLRGLGIISEEEAGEILPPRLADEVEDEE